MANDDEYEIIPIKELHSIKEQLKELKSVISPNDNLQDLSKKTTLSNELKSKNELVDSMNNLTKAIRDLIALFKAGKHEIEQKNDEKHEEDLTVKKILPLTSQFDTMVEQNKAIAKGILLLVNLLSGKESENTTSAISRLSNIRTPPQGNSNQIGANHPASQVLNQRAPANGAYGYNERVYSNPSPAGVSNFGAAPTLPPNYQQSFSQNPPPMPNFLKSGNEPNQVPTSPNNLGNYPQTQQMNGTFNNNPSNGLNNSVPPAPQNTSNTNLEEDTKKKSKKKSFFSFK
ncbi:MAG: hypothetical protein GWP09_02100 [Nitrospiraceae bacterium]|nr:hypothetical protein [Nitrospiraceae bacterium]